MARQAGQPGVRPVGDIDVLVLGDPDRDQLHAVLETAERRLGRLPDRPPGVRGGEAGDSPAAVHTLADGE